MLHLTEEKPLCAGALPSPLKAGKRILCLGFKVGYVTLARC